MACNQSSERLQNFEILFKQVSGIIKDLLMKLRMRPKKIVGNR